jgi:hypothetical protein
LRRILAGLLVVGALAAGGCTKVAQDKDRVLGAIDRTEQLARTFTYTDDAAGHKTVVTGAVRDDFRYRAAATVDGQALVAEVVYDDTRALRVDAVAGSRIVVPGNAGASTSPVSLPAGVWVQDPAGASSLLLSVPSTKPGKDPLADALTALEYVRYSIGQAQTVQKFNPESETYRPRLDPFPRPASGTTRYDLVPPDLPARQRVGTGANIGVLNQVPGVPFFRLMAVYVRDGLVQEVREQISITPRLVDSQSNLEARLNDFTNAATPSDPISRQAAALLFSINRTLAREGQPVLRPRTMDLRFGDLGKPPDVALPAGATQTDLSGLGAYDLLLYESH